MKIDQMIFQKMQSKLQKDKAIIGFHDLNTIQASMWFDLEMEMELQNRNKEQWDL